MLNTGEGLIVILLIMSGGVDCSDNEVNIKILLNSLVVAGDLTYKQRNVLLDKMEADVSQQVLADAYCQSESISVTQYQQTVLLKEQIRFIHHLERIGKLDRCLEYLPDDETLIEREKAGIGLTRPELSVLVAYGKMVLKQQLESDDIANDAFHRNQLAKYFPSALQRYHPQMNHHPLTKEIIATALANQMSNEMGCNFVTRLHEETGSLITDIASAYVVGREIFNFPELYSAIRRLDNQVTTETQYDMLFQCRRMLRRITRWLLRNQDRKLTIEQQISFYTPYIIDLRENLESYLVTDEVQEHQQQAQRLINVGVPQSLANGIVRLSSLYCAMDIGQIADHQQQDVSHIARVYFIVGVDLSLHWFLKQINNQPVDNHWQALARASFREELDWQQRQLTISVIQNTASQPEECVRQWIDQHPVPIKRWESVLTEFKIGTVHEFAKFAVALRELTLLNIHSKSAE